MIQITIVIETNENKYFVHLSSAYLYQCHTEALAKALVPDVKQLHDKPLLQPLLVTAIINELQISRCFGTLIIKGKRFMLHKQSLPNTRPAIPPFLIPFSGFHPA